MGTGAALLDGTSGRRRHLGADWAETEPDPVPVPTIAWVSWHIGWWWSVATDHLRGRPPRQRTDVTWPGAGKATVTWLRDLRADWPAALDPLDDTDLDATAPFPWPDDPQYTVAHMIGWVNAELMKNAAEIGQLRLLRAQQLGGLIRRRRRRPEGVSRRDVQLGKEHENGSHLLFCAGSEAP